MCGWDRQVKLLGRWHYRCHWEPGGCKAATRASLNFPHWPVRIGRPSIQTGWQWACRMWRNAAVGDLRSVVYGLFFHVTNRCLVPTPRKTDVASRRQLRTYLFCPSSYFNIIFKSVFLIFVLLKLTYCIILYYSANPNPNTVHSY